MSLMEPSKTAYDKLTDSNGNEFKIPDYTIGDIYKAIPNHCFERSTVTGLFYVLRDLAFTALIWYLFSTYLTPENAPFTPLRMVFWGLYTFIQGCFGLGLWVLGHECGHQTLTSSRLLNDAIGFVLHSALLSPYYSWKISHNRHHHVHNNIAEDVVWNPRTRNEYADMLGKLPHELSEVGEDTPIVSLGWLILQQTVGWPNYLINNVTGHNFPGHTNGFFQGVNHFNPNSPLFSAKDGKLILISDFGITATILGLTYLCKRFGWVNMLVWYFVPYLWVNNWLAAITFLHHTDPSVPRYTAEAWTYTRGAAATVDRDFGFIGKHIFHGIIETHVLRPYVNTIPFYHAWEASEAIKPILGLHYRSDTRGGPLGFIYALWKNTRSCQWVESADGGRRDVLFFRNKNSLGVHQSKSLS
ncbi:oleate delta-12 desaturase [Xylaria sp. FL0064]|nr:oleate delta-12 desaturase [Xylaria sp. FL0064]